jgi:hypothetical protein
MKLRSSLNPEEQPNLVEGPTRYRKGPNQSQIICGLCGEAYFVDEVVFHQAVSAMEEGIDNPFFCDDCEADYEELSH